MPKGGHGQAGVQHGKQQKSALKPGDSLVATKHEPQLVANSTQKTATSLQLQLAQQVGQGLRDAAMGAQSMHA